MAKYANPTGYDAALAYFQGSDIQHMCSAQPTNYADMLTKSLGSVVPTFSGPAAGDTSGRKITAAQKLAVAVSGTGNVTHVAFAKVGDTTLRYVTTCSSQAVVSGGTMDVSAAKIEIADPS